MAGNKKKKKGSTGKVILLLVELLVLAGIVVASLFILNVIGGTDEEGKSTGVQKITIKEEDIAVNMNDNVKKNETMKGYTNIALFGVDSRHGALAQKTRTDTIMIASINNATKEVKLVSVYRDTYLNQMSEGEEDYGKCNSSYSYGGPTQALSMLNSNLDMDITDFVTIGFEGLKDVIDALGGINIEVDEEEIKHINNYQISMVEEMGGSYTPVTETGYQHLDGLQATAYCRIRYTAGNDFKRTARQREVLQATLNVAKTVSVKELSEICNNVFSEVFTSLDLAEILDILADITQYSIIDEGGFPTADYIDTATIGTHGSCVIPTNLEENVVWLHKFLFDETDYQPSENVIKYSNQIYADTAKYIN